jgi:RNA polymerase sigma-70 factor, ECF subfamily
MVSLPLRTVGDNVCHSEPDIQPLLHRAQQGDAEALYRLLTPHQRKLAGFCYKMLGNAEDAEDAAQETFLRAMRSLNGFRRDASFRTWLYRIALHICIDWKRARRPVESLDTLPEYASGTLENEQTTMNRLLVNQALATLMPRHRAVILLKEWAGWTAEEIAQAMQWNVRRVHNELFYARRALADWVERAEIHPSSEGRKK